MNTLNFCETTNQSDLKSQNVNNIVKLCDKRTSFPCIEQRSIDEYAARCRQCEQHNNRDAHAGNLFVLHVLRYGNSN